MPVSQVAHAHTFRTAAWAAVASSAIGIGASILVSLACWLPDADASGTASAAMHAGVYAFLFAHHGGGTLDGVQVGFLPLGMFIGVTWLSWRAGRVLAAGVRQRAAVAVYSACYAGICAAAVSFAHIGTTQVALVPTVLACALVSGLFCLMSVYREEAATFLRSETFFAVALRAGFAVVAVYLLAGSLLGAGALIDHVGKVTSLSRDVGGGLAGLPVAVVGVLTVPNAAINAMAYLVGPGFAVGSGTVISPLSHSAGVLPAFPLLGALPQEHGASLLVIVLMATTAVVAAAVACRIALRGASLALANATLLVSATLAGVLGALLCTLAAGPAGQGRLRVVGASSWKVGLSLSAEIAVLGLVFLALVPVWRWLARVSASSESVDAAAAADAAAVAPDPDTDPDTDAA